MWGQEHMEKDTQIPACGTLGGSTFLSADCGRSRRHRVRVTQMGNERQAREGREDEDGK